MSNLLFLSLLGCLIVGMAIDTGNICAVRATGDLAAGRPGKAVSSLFAMACAAVVFFVNARMGLLRQPPPWSWPAFVTIAGAVLFAAGSLVNRACAIGTVGRLARGDVSYLATVAGAVAVGLLIPRTQIESRMPDLPALTGATWLGIVIAVTAVLMILCWRHLPLRRLGSYAVVGVSAAMVANWQGNWTWLNLMEQMRSGTPVEFAALACFAAVILGAALTALATGRFRFVRPDPRTMAREAAGGGLMATGAILIPGGNDSLLVYGVPSGSPHAIVGYAVMFTVLLIATRAIHMAGLWPAPDAADAA